MRWHACVLDAGARAAAARLAKIAAPSFYLAGGTALALRLGHRISLDFDLFSSDNRLKERDRLTLLDALGTSGGLKVRESKDGTCHLLLGKTSVSFFHYGYPLLEPVEAWRGIPVASIADIAAMKVSAIVGRGSRKDFVDLYFICGLAGLDTVLDQAARKFPEHEDFLLQAARALVYFDDAQKEPMPRMIARISWREIRSYFEREVPRLVAGKIA